MALDLSGLNRSDFDTIRYAVLQRLESVYPLPGGRSWTVTSRYESTNRNYIVAFAIQTPASDPRFAGRTLEVVAAGAANELDGLVAAAGALDALGTVNWLKSMDAVVSAQATANTQSEIDRLKREQQIAQETADQAAAARIAAEQIAAEQRLRQMEAERQRQAEIDAERERQAALEAERRERERAALSTGACCGQVTAGGPVTVAAEFTQAAPTSRIDTPTPELADNLVPLAVPGATPGGESYSGGTILPAPMLQAQAAPEDVAPPPNGSTSWLAIAAAVGAPLVVVGLIVFLRR